jgi:hypothetical protein
MISLMLRYGNLRALVAYLGEKHCAGWWDTSYLDGTGRRYLELNFPRSATAAGVAAAGTAAKRLHDSRIGRSRVYHLFRFPYEIEERVHSELLHTDQEELWSQLKDKPTALDGLRSLAESTLDAPEGPVQVGTQRHIMIPKGVAELARHYLSAFERGIVCLPYFSAEKDR